MVKLATTAGKAANPKLKVFIFIWNICPISQLGHMPSDYVIHELDVIQVGVCGEHGGEPSSIEFFAAAV